MQQLKCDMCGSPDIIKQDGLFVCQNCGTKYSVEEARKLMIEGTVDVSGSTVNINKTERINNLYQVARRFRDDNNPENAAKYYSMILEEDPNSWEATFYTVYFNAVQCKIIEIVSAANSIRNCLNSVISLIQTNCQPPTQNEAIAEVVNRSEYISNMLFNGARNHYIGIDTRHASLSSIQEWKSEYINRMAASRDIMYVCGDVIDAKFKNNPVIKKFADTSWQSGIELHNKFITENKSLYYFYDDKQDIAIINSYNNKIIGDERKIKLKNEIEDLEREIKKYPTEQGSGGMAYFFIVMGIIMILVWTSIKEEVWALLVGIAEIILGIILIIGRRNGKEVVENNKIIVADLRQKINQKEMELKNLG